MSRSKHARLCFLSYCKHFSVWMRGDKQVCSALLRSSRWRKSPHCAVTPLLVIAGDGEMRKLTVASSSLNTRVVFIRLARVNDQSMAEEKSPEAWCRGYTAVSSVCVEGNGILHIKLRLVLTPDIQFTAFKTCCLTAARSLYTAWVYMISLHDM